MSQINETSFSFRRTAGDEALEVSSKLPDPEPSSEAEAATDPSVARETTCGGLGCIRE